MIGMYLVKVSLGLALAFFAATCGYNFFAVLLGWFLVDLFILTIGKSPV